MNSLYRNDKKSYIKTIEIKPIFVSIETKFIIAYNCNYYYNNYNFFDHQ